MPAWIYDLPTLLLGILVVGIFTALSIGGLFATRGAIRRIMGQSPGHGVGVDVFVNAVVLIYGLIAGLIAVSVLEQYSRADDLVSSEATSLAALYRDVQFYRQPWRAQLTREMRAYTRYVIDTAWPLQRDGIIPADGVRYVDALQATLYSYEPRGQGQIILATTTVGEFNRYVELRRARLYAVGAALPASLWVVIIFGAVATIALTYFLSLERLNVHLAMTGLLAVIISLLIFVIMVHDHPFRGAASVSAHAFEIVYDQLMRSH